jgi:hypothetical protein
MHEQVREAPNFGEKCHRVSAVLRLARLFFLRAVAFFIRVLPGKNGPFGEGVPVPEGLWAGGTGRTGRPAGVPLRFRVRAVVGCL